MELPIQVAARIHRPATDAVHDGNGNIAVPSASCVHTIPAPPSPPQFDSCMTGLVEVGQHSFPVTYALPENCTQSQVYYQTVFPLINLFLEGFDVSIITYGQRGQGKTYTLYGPGFECVFGEQDQGVLQRAVHEIFAHIKNNGDRTYAVSISWMEIGEDSVRDLLGVANVNCRSVSEVFHWLQVGLTAKRTQPLNTAGQTHTLFTITLEQEWISKEGLLQHRLSTAGFSDLAGTERLVMLNALEQPAHIPKDAGLRALEQIVYTLTDPALMYSVNGNIPYNQTALTTLLKDSFGGRAQTLVILCISPYECDVNETVSNLQFAFKMQCVRNFVVMNTFSDNNTPISGGGGITGGLPQPTNDTFGLQFAASQWLKLVSNAEGLFSKLMSNNAVSELDKEQIEEWLFLKQECEECLSSSEVLRSQKQLRPIQEEVDEADEALSEPDTSCQQNSDNESDSESQRPDLEEKLDTLMKELHLKTDELVKDKYQEFMQRQPKPVMESQDSLLQQKEQKQLATAEQQRVEVEEHGNEDRRQSTGGRRRSIQPGASLSSAELAMLNRVASREQTTANSPKATSGHDDFLDASAVDLQTNNVLPLRVTHNTPVELVQKKLRKLDTDIEARLRQIKEYEQTMQLKQNIITELVKNSETRTNAKQRFNKKKSKLEAEYEKAKKQMDKAILQGKERAEIERLRLLIEHLKQRLSDLISIKHIAGDSAQKVKKLQQSLHESKKIVEDLQKKVKKERKLHNQLEAELQTLKEKENITSNVTDSEGSDLIASAGGKIQLKEVQARISHLDHVLREKSDNLAEYTGRTAVGADGNTNEEREGLRHEIRNLRRTRDHLLDQRCSLDRKLKRDKILSYREERKLLECDEAIEAIDAAIEFKNELICGHKSIDTSEHLQREKGEQMLMARLNKLSPEEMRTLLYKYFTKVIDLRDSSRKLEAQLMHLERERDAWEWKERALSNAVRQARLEGERNAVLLQRQHEMKLTLMLRHLADETSLSSSGFSDQFMSPSQRYLRATNFSLTPSGTDSDFDMDFYKNSLHQKMLKPPKHSEIEICPTLPDALTKYKPLDKLKDKERESKNKLLAKFQVLTRYAGHSVMQANQANVDDGDPLHGDVAGAGGLHVSTLGGTAVAHTGGSHKKKKDKAHKETLAAAAAAIPQENLKRLLSTPPATKVTRQKNKIIIQDASRRS